MIPTHNNDNYEPTSIDSPKGLQLSNTEMMDGNCVLLNGSIDCRESSQDDHVNQVLESSEFTILINFIVLPSFAQNNHKTIYL